MSEFQGLHLNYCLINIDGRMEAEDKYDMKISRIFCY